MRVAGRRKRMRGRRGFRRRRVRSRPAPQNRQRGPVPACRRGSRPDPRRSGSRRPASPAGADGSGEPVAQLDGGQRVEAELVNAWVPDGVRAAVAEHGGRLGPHQVEQQRGLFGAGQRAQPAGEVGAAAGRGGPGSAGVPRTRPRSSGGTVTRPASAVRSSRVGTRCSSGAAGRRRTAPCRGRTGWRAGRRGR